MNVRLELVLALLIAGAVNAVGYLLAVVPLARFAKVKLVEVGFGSGPKVFTTRRAGGGMRYELRLLPITAWVKPVGFNPYEEHEESVLSPGLFPWREAPRARRAFVFQIAPRVLASIVAATALGPGRALAAAWTALPQALSGMLGPFTTARALLARSEDVLRSEGLIVAAALVLAKFVGSSVVLLAFELGGLVLEQGMDPKRMANRELELVHAKRMAKIRGVVFLVLSGPVVAWGVAIVAWLFGW